jgi:PRTRC genetic system protein C
MKVETPTREFVFNGKSLPDPNPSMSVEQAREMPAKSRKKWSLCHCSWHQ